MSGTGIIVAILVVVALGYAISLAVTMRRVERHGVTRVPDAPKRTWVHTVASLLLYPVAISLSLLAMVIVVALLPVLPRKYLVALIRPLCRMILLASGAVLIVKEKRHAYHPRPYILMINHQSLFDSFILGAVMYRPINGVGAAHQFRYPVWGFLLRQWGVVPIERENLEAAIQSIEAVRKLFAQGVSLFIAAEGTRTLDGKLQPFKKGPFHLAMQAKGDILPLVIRGAFDIKRKTDWRLKPGIVTAEFGEVIPYSDFAEKTVEETRDLVRQRFVRILGREPSGVGVSNGSHHKEVE